jgi:adenosylcobyric acid synthase
MTDRVPETPTLLVAGTASHVGKSTVAVGLCRRLAEAGYAVAPFKAQNMSNNARAVPRPDAVRDDTALGGNGSETARHTDAPVFGEIGVSQWVQARAAGVRPTTDHNPVLLKPTGDGQSQVVLDGRPVADAGAGDYYADHWGRGREAAVAAHRRLAESHDVVVAEGAGSVAEINLHDRDLANVETARFADASILLVADIERGGVFASILGTLELMPEDLRERVAGVVISKFRGDRSLLTPGIETIESRTGVPVLAVLPYEDPGLPAEDSLALPARGSGGVWGDDDGVPDERCVSVAVPRLPHLSNATDLEPLAREPGVRVRFVPVEGSGARDSLADADAVVLPGTKNTVDDLLSARESGVLGDLRRFDGPVVGLCGGYQFLGERLLAADREGTGDRTTVAGAGLLPVETRFGPEKRVAPVSWTLDGVGPLAGVRGAVEGYEIHTGRTRATGPVARPFPAEGVSAGAASGKGNRVFGTYLHGLFGNERVRAAFLDSVFASAGVSRADAVATAAGSAGEAAADTGGSDPTDAYDRAADLVSSVPLERLGIGVTTSSDGG